VASDDICNRKGESVTGLCAQRPALSCGDSGEQKIRRSGGNEGDEPPSLLFAAAAAGVIARLVTSLLIF